MYSGRPNECCNTIIYIFFNYIYLYNTIRWWVAKHGSHQTNIPVTNETLLDSKQSIDKLRLIIRFLLGSLDNFKEDHYLHGINHLSYLDKYMILELKSFENEINLLYSSFQYNKVCAKILNFIKNQVSGLYVHNIKDRYSLYNLQYEEIVLHLNMF